MTADRQHHAQSTSPQPADWPGGVRPISLEGLAHLGVGNDGTLYWDGKPVEVRKSLTLSWWQQIGAVIVAVAAVIGSGAASVSAWSDYKNEARQARALAAASAPEDAERREGQDALIRPYSQSIRPRDDAVRQAPPQP